jgi:hypothetical protein
VIIATRDQFNRPIKKQCFRKVSGWGETLEAPDGSIIEIRIDKRPTRWYITEERTGYAVTLETFATRAKALAYLTPEFLQKIADRLKAPEMITAADRLADYILTH